MPDYTLKRIDDMYSTYRGGMKHARAELGVTIRSMCALGLRPMTKTKEENYDEKHQPGDPTR